MFEAEIKSDETAERRSTHPGFRRNRAISRVDQRLDLLDQQARVLVRQAIRIGSARLAPGFLEIVGIRDAAALGKHDRLIQVAVFAQHQPPRSGRLVHMSAA